MKSFTYLNVLTFLLFINLLQPTTVVCSFGNETDRLALLKFKESIVADPQGLLNSWNDSVHFCKWRGITCGRRHQRVTTLNLPDGELHGTISPYIGNLSFLKNFSLSNNNFSGKIPHQVDHLFRLRHLKLKTNMLEGHIPVNLTSCPELSIISIGDNRLTGKIPSEIGSMRKLQYLALHENNLTGGIPPSLANLSSIRILSLTENYNLGGTVPEEMGRLRSLWFFGTCYCNLSEYAVGVEPSTQGDVYSYGIVVLQLFTGRRPTDEMFTDNCNIHTFVKRGIQGRIMQIVDPTLIATLEEETATSTTNTEVTSIRGYNNVIKTDEENIDSESLSKMNTYVYKCILPTLKIGLACSEESPRNRMSMEEVLRELHRIKNAYNAIDIPRQKPNRS